MEPNATLDQASPAAASKPVVEASGEPHAEDAVQEGSAPRTSQASVSAALAAANSAARAAANASPVRFPGEDGGQSLAEMAQRDLDAALQLLTDRAQYITGAAGAAIALRRSGKNDMLCRASTGSNAPELGALLSTEFGLSGESVRTRRPLRCDDAERDARVNREVCREMGIASVVVMPVVQDDEVLGVFELFSGKAKAFGERDVSALERLGEMVETAVRLARAAEALPERLQTVGPAAERVTAEDAGAEVLEIPERVFEPALEADLEPILEVETDAATELPPAIPTPAVAPPEAAPQHDVPVPAQPVLPKRPLFWSATLHTGGEVAKPAEPDQSHVPPVLRNLRKCEACGFPVSAGRVLCVECEEKKWRGQLKVPQTGAVKQVSGQAPVSGPAARAFAAAQSAASTASATALPRRSAVEPVVAPVSANVQAEGSKKVSHAPLATVPPPGPVLNPTVLEVATEKAATAQAAQALPPEVVFSAGLESSQSWFAANKYILGALLVVAAVVAAILLMR